MKTFKTFISEGLKRKKFYQSKDGKTHIYVTTPPNHHGFKSTVDVVKHENNKVVITSVVDKDSDWKEVKNPPSSVVQKMQKLADKHNFGKLGEEDLTENKQKFLKVLQDKKSDAASKLKAIDSLLNLGVNDREIDAALKKAGIKNADALLK